MKNAYGYYRVSTEEQATEGKSIEAQKRICSNWAKDNGYKIIKDFIDEGKSATTINRPALKELISYVEDTPDISAVIVQDTDRLARNTLDHLTIKSILKKNNIVLVSVSQPMLDDSPEGSLIDTIIASVNAFQSQITGRKTSKVLIEKCKLGWFPGAPPMGYENINNPMPSSSLDRRIIDIDKTNSQYIKELFEMYSSGNESFASLTEYFRSKNIKPPKGKTINTSLIHSILRNPFYMGVFKWGGITYRGSHPPIVSKELFNKVQDIISAHNQNGSRKRIHKYLLRGFIFHDSCSKRMWAEKHIKSNGSVYELYYCPIHKKDSYIDVESLEMQVEDLFQSIQISPEYVQQVLTRANEIVLEARSSTDSERKRLNKEKGTIEHALRETEDSRFLHKTIDDSTFQRLYARYKADLEIVEEAVKNVDKDYSKNIQALEEVLRLAENIGQAYKEADFNQKRNYLGIFIDKLWIEKGEIARYSLKDNIKVLIEEGSVRVSNNWLACWNDFRTSEIESFVYEEALAVLSA